MKEAAELGNYLPLSFKSSSEQDCIVFLWQWDGDAQPAAMLASGLDTQRDANTELGSLAGPR